MIKEKPIFQPSSFLKILQWYILVDSKPDPAQGASHLGWKITLNHRSTGINHGIPFHGYTNSSVIGIPSGEHTKSNGKWP